MKNNSFDDHIKRQFAEYKPKVPGHIWDNIMSKKDRERRAGFFFRFNNGKLRLILFVLFIVAGTGVFLYKLGADTYNDPEKNKITGNNTAGRPEPGSRSVDVLALNENNDNSPASPKAGLSKNDESSDLKSQGINADNKIASPNENNTLSGKHDGNNVPVNKIESAGHDIATTEIMLNDNHVIKTENSRANIKAGRTLPGKIPGKAFKTRSKRDGNTVSALENETIIAKRKSKANDAGLVAVQTENPVADIDINPLAGSPNESIAGDASLEPRLNKYTLNLTVSLPGSTKSFPLARLNGSMLNIPCPALERDDLSRKRYFEIYGGPDYAFRSLNDTANSSYLQKRKESTSFSSAFSFGIRYTKIFLNGMSLRVGINYSQVNEKFKFIDGNITQLVYSTNNEGDTTGSYTSTGTRYKTTHNKYRSIDIPLLIGYELGSARLHTNINFGPVINIYSWQKGDVLDTLNKPVNITTGKSNSAYQFKTNTGVGFMGAVSLYYRLRGGFSILAEPYIRYNLSAVNKAALTLKQKYTTVGLRLGLKINF